MAKSKLTPERQQLIIEYLRGANYASTACAAAGIAEDTFYTWLEKGREGRKGYSEFADAVKKAQAEAEMLHVNRIVKAGLAEQYVLERRAITKKDGSTEEIVKYKAPEWTASAWILERTRWERFGQHTSMDVQQKAVVYLERLSAARQLKIETVKTVNGTVKTVNPDNLLSPIEVPPAREEGMPAAAQQVTAAQSNQPRKLRPIFEIIKRVREKRKETVKAAVMSSNSDD